MRAVQFYYKQNRFQQLRGFCYSAEAGSISAAARRLSLSQPSVTQQIQALEREMGVQLFERRQGGIKLTPDGAVLFKMTMPLVVQVETLQERFNRIRSDVGEGSIDLAAGGSTLLRVLPGTIGQFKREHPHIELRLHNVSGTEGLALLRAGNIDFAVGPLLRTPEDLEFHPIASYFPVLITALGHPLGRKKRVSLEQISRYPLVLPPPNLSTRVLVDSTFRKFGLNYQIAMEVGGWEVIKKYVEMGMGISIVMSVCLTGEEKLRVINVDEFFPKKAYGIVLSKNKVLSPQARLFTTLLLSEKQ